MAGRTSLGAAFNQTPLQLALRLPLLPQQSALLLPFAYFFDFRVGDLNPHQGMIYRLDSPESPVFARISVYAIDAGMSRTHQKRGRLATWLAARSKRFGILAALAMATAYPLSLGPFIWLNDRGMVSEPAMALLRPVYVPLFMMQLLSPGERAINWYVGLWLGEAPDDFAEGAVLIQDVRPDGRKGISFVTGDAHEDIPDGEAASDEIADGAVFQTVTAPDGRKGISLVGP